jgi:ketosteroid isomerase-like protein
MDIAARIRGWGEGLWRPGRDQAMTRTNSGAGSGSLEERVNRLENEREIERVFRRYHNCYDAHDLAGILSCYTDDAVQVNSFGTLIGQDSLRGSYERLISRQKLIIHYGIGVYVTLDPADPDKGLLTARYMGFMVPWEGRPNSHGGTYVNRMRRDGGEWRIAEQRITFNYRHEVELSAPRTAADWPTADLSLKQADLIEERYLHA